jgi:translation initiation factor 4E
MHKLNRCWTIWANGPSKQRKISTPLRVLIKFNAIESMWKCLNNLPKPDEIVDDGNIYIFQDGITPTWEDPANKDGGRWMFSIPVGDLSVANIWQNLYLNLFGELLEPSNKTFEISGIILARRRNYTRFSIWTKNKFNSEAILHIGNIIKAELPKNIALEYQDHNSSFEVYRHKL